MFGTIRFNPILEIRTFVGLRNPRGSSFFFFWIRSFVMYVYKKLIILVNNTDYALILILV